MTERKALEGAADGAGTAQAGPAAGRHGAARLRHAPLIARLRHILLFAALGAVGTLAQYTVLVALVRGAGLGPVLASTAGFLVGGLVNYQLNRRIAFRSSKSHAEAAGKFFTVAGIGLGLNALLMTLFTRVLGLPYLPAQLLCTGLLVLWHYAGNALWTFRESRPVTPAPAPAADAGSA
ncbi:GtrA family protein [Ancylobacter lacus]|uniref:GtrA family protein n=1 Tax=Ancylobacter lacus TaxID=2579970 RepID=UPI001BCA9689|nr:GtrA family protein [Ancylobacter lacus]MBS7538764.1 GtrA family protein [Ancylobacter lacus]